MSTCLRARVHYVCTCVRAVHVEGKEKRGEEKRKRDSDVPIAIRENRICRFYFRDRTRYFTDAVNSFPTADLKKGNKCFWLKSLKSLTFAYYCCVNKFRINFNVIITSKNSSISYF